MLAALGYGFEVLFHHIDCVVNLLYMGHILVKLSRAKLVLAVMALMAGDARCPKANFSWTPETSTSNRVGHKAFRIMTKDRRDCRTLIQTDHSFLNRPSIG